MFQSERFFREAWPAISQALSNRQQMSPNATMLTTSPADTAVIASSMSRMPSTTRPVTT